MRRRGVRCLTNLISKPVWPPETEPTLPQNLGVPYPYFKFLQNQGRLTDPPKTSPVLIGRWDFQDGTLSGYYTYY